MKSTKFDVKYRNVHTVEYQQVAYNVDPLYIL